MTNADRNRLRARLYLTAVVAVGLATFALVYVLLATYRALFDETIPTRLAALCYAVAGLAWLLVSTLLWTKAGNLGITLAEQDEHGCDLLIAGATEQRRRLVERREIEARKRLRIYEASEAAKSAEAAERIKGGRT